MNFAQRLQIALKTSLVSNYQLAKTLGVHQTTIKNWLSAKTEPRLDMIEKVSSALELPISFFLEEQPFEDLKLLDESKETIFLALKKLSLIKGPDYAGELSTASYYRIVGSCIDRLYVDKDGTLKIIIKGIDTNQTIQANGDINSMFKLTSRHIDLINAFDKLNEQGKDVAIIRIQELTKIKDYTE